MIRPVGFDDSIRATQNHECVSQCTYDHVENAAVTHHLAPCWACVGAGSAIACSSDDGACVTGSAIVGSSDGACVAGPAIAGACDVGS